MDLLSVALIVAAVGFAAWRPRGLPEPTVAVPAALLLIAIGAVSLSRTTDELRTLLPTVVFLAALLVIAHCCATLGVFDWLGLRMARTARGDASRWFLLAYLAAAATTAALSLDATVLLLTPVLLTTSRALGVSAAPTGYAAVGLANSASTLLPVSNLTNLLAFTATGLGFLQFTTVMAVPWVATLLVQYVGYRIAFRHDLRSSSRPEVADAGSTSGSAAAPKAALVCLIAILIGFGVSSLVHVEPVVFAVIGAVVLAALALIRRRTSAAAVLVSTQPMFLVFVGALAVLVAAIADGGVGHWLSGLLPTDTGLLDLLVVAAISAVVANVVNNIPATLLLMAAVGVTAPPAILLAVLLGVNIGPNLTYTGSLANLLWRTVLRDNGEEPSVTRFTVLGVLTVPVCLVTATIALAVMCDVVL
ncbi:SLC13 family permease [Williamsia sterculiae]|uniref:Arsenite efflux membrane protein ArsB n=1 Tax=Williamsia sterculiae TaxID=1344003 RepID=A0A1N7G9L1_9NOCA|nr:SLC13 family permease [Williamsia sterculiae]SIS09176.1 arsenite efflux membrane protein ArsB [Williamsia sterculiae]